jgi:hypothetical protein
MTHYTLTRLIGQLRSQALAWMLVCTAALLLGVSRPGIAQSAYQLPNWVVAGGGGSATGDDWELAGTLGQPEAGPALTGGAFSLTGGFWTAFEAGVYRPDAQVKASTSPDYLGDDAYNAGTEVVQAVRAGATAIFHLQVQNDGDDTDHLLVRGPAGSGGWTVAYFPLVGETPITAEVVAGTWDAGAVAPHAGVELRVEVTPGPGVLGGSVLTLPLLVSSLSDPTQSDTVSAQVVADVPAEVIVDNADLTGVTKTGRWFASATAPGFYGTNYLYDDPAQKGTTAVGFTPRLPGGGWYVVALRWRNSDATLAAAVPVAIAHRDGTTNTTVNQRQNGGSWVTIGTHYFTRGTAGSVTLSTGGTQGYVIADAVRFTPAPRLQLLSPNGGESWTVGTAQTIRWRADADVAGAVTVELLQSSAVVQTLTTEASAADGSYAWTLPADLAGSYQVRISSQTEPALTDTSDAAFTAQPAGPPGEIVIDNLDAARVTVTGRWYASTAAPGFWGTNYLYDDAAQRGTTSVRFTPSIAAPGLYQLFLRWRESASTLASNVPVEIVHTTGTSTVTVNQRLNGGSWVSIGYFTFAAGTAGSITLRTTGVNGVVIADAVRLLPAARAEVTLDNTAASGVTLTGRWFASSTAPGYWGTNYLYDDPALRGTSTARFAPALPVAGTYAVFLRWRESASTLASNVPVTIAHAGGSATRTLNQRQGGGAWYLLGAWNFAAGTAGAITLGTTGVNGYVIADAVRFVQITEDVIVDNAAPSGVQTVGSWYPSAASPGFYGTNYLYDHLGQKGTTSVRFTPSLPLAGTYAVYQRWRQSAASLAPNVPVDITSAGGTATVTVNQQTGGGDWVLLGTFPFAAGTSGNVLVRTTGTAAHQYVIADAVRFIRLE